MDRALDAGKIKSIVQELDRLASQNAIGERVKMHLASVGLPSKLPHYAGQETVDVVVRHVRNDPAFAATPGAIDIAARSREALEVCAAALETLRNDSGQLLHPFLLGLVGKNLPRFVMGADGALRPRDDVIADMTRIRGFFLDAEARAKQLAQDFRAAGGGHEASVERGNEVLYCALNFIDAAGAAADSDRFRALDGFARRLPMGELSALRPDASPAQILAALRGFADASDTANLRFPDGVRPPSDPAERNATETFVRRWALLQLPPDARDTLLETLRSPNGQKAIAYVAGHAGTGQATAVRDNAAVRDLIDCLANPMVRPRVDDHPAPAPAQVPAQAPAGDAPAVASLSPADRCAYNPADAFSGSAAPRLRAGLLGPAGVLDPGGDPARQLHGRIDAGARAFLAGNFAMAMRDLSEAIADEFEDGDPLPGDGSAPAAGDEVAEQYEHAFNVGFPEFGDSLEPFQAGGDERAPIFRMPDGSLLPADDPAAARNALARAVTGRADADYATLSPAERAYTNVFVALASCNLFEAAERGVSTALSPEFRGDSFQFPASRDVDRVFMLSGSPEEGFTIRCGKTCQISGVFFGEGDGYGAVSADGAGSASFMVEIRLSPADLDALAGRDWLSFNPDAFKEASALGRDAALPELEGAVPQALGFLGDVSASFAMDLDAAPEAPPPPPAEPEQPEAPPPPPAEPEQPEAPPPPPAPPAAEPAPVVGAAAAEAAAPANAGVIPAIRSQAEFEAFFQSLTLDAQFGEVEEGPIVNDIFGDPRLTFTYRGIVFRSDEEGPDVILPRRAKAPDGGFVSERNLEEEGNLKEAMGLGAFEEENGVMVPKGTWGATGKSGVSAAKRFDGTITYRGRNATIYVIDTSKLSASGHAWDMESTVYLNALKDRADETTDETNAEVNCSSIPASAIVGWISVPDSELYETADHAEKFRLLKSDPAVRLQFNPKYVA